MILQVDQMYTLEVLATVFEMMVKLLSDDKHSHNSFKMVTLVKQPIKKWWPRNARVYT